jgi:hypothetical protein
VRHGENNSGKLDRNFIGVPKIGAAGKAKLRLRQQKLSRVPDDWQAKPAFWTIALVVYYRHTPVL